MLHKVAKKGQTGVSIRIKCKCMHHHAINSPYEQLLAFVETIKESKPVGDMVLETVQNRYLNERFV